MPFTWNRRGNVKRPNRNSIWKKFRFIYSLDLKMTHSYLFHYHPINVTCFTDFLCHFNLKSTPSPRIIDSIFLAHNSTFQNELNHHWVLFSTSLTVRSSIQLRIERIIRVKFNWKNLREREKNMTRSKNRTMENCKRSWKSISICACALCTNRSV